jgi:aliphatic sulfonates family ABC transporter substrate-binding protein
MPSRPDRLSASLLETLTDAAPPYRPIEAPARLLWRQSRTMLRLLMTAFLLFAYAEAAEAAEPSLLRVGYQKNGSLVILRQQHRLEDAMRVRGVTVQWVEFQSGPPLLEAMNAGSIDFGATGDTPPIFAQAAGVDFVYVGSLPVSGANAAVLVRAGGPVQGVADLRGRRIALTKGSSAHYVIVRVLAGAGLSLADVQPIYLQPADAAAAFRAGSVDAWSIWDPFYALAERDPQTRVLTTAEVAPSNSFFLARRALAQGDPGLIVAVMREVNEAALWSEQHQPELASTMAEITGIDVDTQRIAAARGTYRTEFLSDAVVRQQQAVADTFFGLKVIPSRIDVRAAVWQPPAGTRLAGAAP